MKIIGKVTILLFFVITLTSCNSFTTTPTTINPTDIISTSAAIAKTAVAETQTAIVETAVISTVTPLPSPDQFIMVTSTATPLGFSTPTPVFWAPPPDKLDYAMTTAQKIYTLLPYINNTHFLTGEYSGCVETNDFQNWVRYTVMYPNEKVNTAFVNYFQSEKWEFTEPTPKAYNNNVSGITYDVYRISSKEIPAFERLQIVIVDESTVYGENHVTVQANLTHIETKENLRYLSSDFSANCPERQWLWIRLNK
jgi:hypothetical protein